MWGYDGFGFGGGGMGIGMLLFWGLIIFGVVMLARGFGGSSGSGASVAALRDRTPLDVLGERYARGEIGNAEFAQKRNDLGAKTS
ncbi:MAG: SHOCT domain-containing protein [Burkholderiales bacterium]|nr:SHOCT domain-containing protein [Burkholderiales bacterium]